MGVSMGGDAGGGIGRSMNGGMEGDMVGVTGVGMVGGMEGDMDEGMDRGRDLDMSVCMGRDMWESALAGAETTAFWLQPSGVAAPFQ